MGQGGITVVNSTLSDSFIGVVGPHARLRNNVDYSGGEARSSVKPEAVPVWRSPVTQAVLSWIGFFSGTGFLGCLLGGVRRSYQFFENKERYDLFGSVAIWFLLAAVLLAISIFSLRLISKKKVRLVPGIDLVASFDGREISVNKIS